MTSKSAHDLSPEQLLVVAVLVQQGRSRQEAEGIVRDDQTDDDEARGQNRDPARYWNGVSDTWDEYWPSNQQTCPVCDQAEHMPAQTYTCCFVHHTKEPVTGWNFVCGECGHAYEDGSLTVCDACAHDL